MNSSTRRSRPLAWLVIINCAYIQFNASVKQDITWKVDDTHPQKVCTSVNDGVIASKQVSSVLKCSNLCSNTIDCKAFTFTNRSENPNCYLMQAIPKRTNANSCGDITSKKQFVKVSQVFDCQATNDDDQYRTVMLSDRNTFTYRVVQTELLDASAAKNDCISTGGTLVKLSTFPMLNMITQLYTCNQLTDRSYWVDGSNTDVGLNVWKHFDQASMNMNASFWVGGQPDNTTVTESCVFLNHNDHKLDVENCTVPMGYICGKP